MSLDLTLLPFDSDKGIHFSHTVLSLLTNVHDLFDDIKKIDAETGKKVPEDFSSYVSRDDDYEDTHYGKTLITPYGNPVHYILVKDLLELSLHPKVIAYKKHNAIWAYLSQLEPETKVALFWH